MVVEGFDASFTSQKLDYLYFSSVSITSIDTEKQCVFAQTVKVVLIKFRVSVYHVIGHPT